MYTSNYSRNQNNSNRISSSQHRQSNSPRTGFSSTSSNSEEQFQYKGSNKQQWAKLQNKIKQKMMAQNIWYLEDKDEVARRSTPAPPISTIPPLPFETPIQREDRMRLLQKLYDDHRRKKESKFEDYEELFALDYGKGHRCPLSLPITHLIIGSRQSNRRNRSTYHQRRHPLQGPQNPPSKQMGTQQRQRQQRSDKQAGTPTSR